MAAVADVTPGHPWRVVAGVCEEAPEELCPSRSLGSLLYSFRADDAICAGHDPLAAGAGVPACTVALRPGDLARRGWAGHDGALVAAGAAPPAGPGEMLVFCHPVTCASAAVRRSGEVRAAGWLPDHVGLGYWSSTWARG